MSEADMNDHELESSSASSIHNQPMLRRRESWGFDERFIPIEEIN